MTLKEKINIDLKEAMKAGNKVQLLTIRSIRALILDFEKSGANRELTTDEETALISSAVKRRKDSIEQYNKANRVDLAEIEVKELEILSKYLPKQLTDEELKEGIEKLASEIGASSRADFPKLMPLSVRTFKGKADGRKIKEIVDEILS